jgi:hypothetical protein
MKWSYGSTAIRDREIKYIDKATNVMRVQAPCLFEFCSSATSLRTILLSLSILRPNQTFYFTYAQLLLKLDTGPAVSSYA